MWQRIEFVTRRRRANRSKRRSWWCSAPHFRTTLESDWKHVLKGLGNLANIGALVKQAQEMGGKMQAIQAELKTKKATGSSGGGLVEVDVNGLADVLAVRIDPTLVAKGDREMIEDLLPTAINAAQAKAKQMHSEALQQLAGGLPMGGFADMLSQLPGANPDAGGT